MRARVNAGGLTGPGAGTRPSRAVNPSIPGRKNCSGIGRLDLLAKAGMIELHQCIVSLIRGTAEPVAYNNNAVTEVYRIKHSRQYTHVSLRARDNKPIGFAFLQMPQQRGLGE